MLIVDTKPVRDTYLFADIQHMYMGADKSLARPGRKQATATEEFDVYISYLLSKLEEY
jgi:hypothetical protein